MSTDQIKLVLVVACALIDADGRVLLAQRPEGKSMAGLWEFPGGKVEPGESPTDALAREDMKAVAAAARSMGIAKTKGDPGALMGKLPLEFKTLGLGVHRDFDTMALDAELVGRPKHTLGQLAATLQKCVACHASFQFKATDG